MASATITKIQTDADGKVRFQFGKREYEFSSLAAAKAAVRDQLILSRDTLEVIAMGLALTRQPTLSNPAALQGHTVTVDFTLANWGTVS